MRRLLTNAREFIATRWSGVERMQAVLTKSLPRNISWIHTLGSLLLLYICFQFVTGVLLGLYYNPGPESAYDSIQYIREELFLGKFLHRLHRYGAGFVIVTAFLHMARSYFLAAYKKPRELLWLSGVVLFVLLTIFAFTGQLLPFDQRGYWATVVGIRIASSPPIIGDAVGALLRGGYGDIGAVTLSRFYITHVSVLPLLLAGLIGMHLGILQRVGSAGPTEGPPEPKKSFYPHQAFKDTVVAALGAAALIIVAAFVSSAETGPADPNSGDYVPRPEWYFFAHFMILKLLPANLQILGTFVLPTLAGIILVALPFIDRSPERSPRRRRALTGIGILVVLSVIVLTGWGIADLYRGQPEAIATKEVEDPVELGREYFRVSDHCIQCHAIHGSGGTTGPDLTNVGERLQLDYMRAWIRNPKRFKPDTVMPAFEGTERELDAVIEYLLSIEPEQTQPEQGDEQ